MVKDCVTLASRSTCLTCYLQHLLYTKGVSQDSRAGARTAQLHSIARHSFPKVWTDFLLALRRSLARVGWVGTSKFPRVIAGAARRDSNSRSRDLRLKICDVSTHDLLASIHCRASNARHESVAAEGQQAVRIPAARPKRSASDSIWQASSRVGARTQSCGSLKVTLSSLQNLTTSCLLTCTAFRAGERTPNPCVLALRGWST